MTILHAKNDAVSGFDTQAAAFARSFGVPGRTTSDREGSYDEALSGGGTAAGGHGDDDRVRAAGPAVRGPQWRAGLPFTNAVSLVVNCESQEEIDHYWEKLAAGGGEQIQCGWLKDKFGMPWQIVPRQVWDWLRGEDPARVQRVTAALWQMEKLDLAELERASADG